MSDNVSGDGCPCVHYLSIDLQIPGTFACINARDKYECMTLIDRDEADIANLDAEDLYLGGRLFDLEPFLLEEYNGSEYCCCNLCAPH